MSTTQPLARVTGWSGDPAYFQFRQYDRLDADAIVDVLRGRVAGVIFRDVIDRAAARELLRRFWDSPARRSRGGEVCESQGYYLGAYHFQKPTATYLDESAAIADAVATVLDVPDEPSRMLRDHLGQRLAAEGAVLRLAEDGGRQACPVLIRHWNAGGEYALQPHDDESQCRYPEQAGFELQRALDHKVCAVNMCLENGEGGRLVFWNVVPDDESKRRLDLYYSGMPYPLETLRGIEAIWLDIRQGDIYVFNGGHVHGVEASIDASKRTTLAWNMGFIDDRTVVTWT